MSSYGEYETHQAHPHAPIRFPISDQKGVNIDTFENGADALNDSLHKLNSYHSKESEFNHSYQMDQNRSFEEQMFKGQAGYIREQLGSFKHGTNVSKLTQ